MLVLTPQFLVMVGAQVLGVVLLGVQVQDLWQVKTLDLWMSDSWGEDLVANIVDGSLYYWDATNGKTTRMVELSTVAGASDVPTTVRKVMVSDTDSHVLCFGAQSL